jgi:hypothetical protein
MSDNKLIVINDGNKVTRILVAEFRGIKAYSLGIGTIGNIEIFEAISEARYNSIIAKARANHALIYSK